MYSNDNYLRCDHTFALTRDIRNEKFGFRCCAD